MSFIHIIYILVIFTHVVSALITLAFIIPLQFRQSQVKNGLVRLRKQMLAQGVLSFTIALVSFVALFLRVIPYDHQLINFAITMFVATHALGLLGKSMIDYDIYHHQYSEISKEMHEKMHILEKMKEKKQSV